MTKEQLFLAKIETHKGLLYKVSKMYMDQPEDQEDLFQEIIYQLWKTYDNFRNESQFSTWMYRVAINTAIVFFKKDRKKINTQEIPSDNIKADESDTHQKERQLDIFYKAVYQLEKTEKALILYHLEGYSHKAIGESMGISEVNARVKLNRIKSKLKDLIEQLNHEL